MRKNKFLTFLFSCIPGCGHMYLGYMKRGAEFMAMFAASIYFAVVLNTYIYILQFLGIIFILVVPIIWFYQMFDSMHTISQMRKFEIEIPEDDGFFIPGVSGISNLNAPNIFKNKKIVKAIAAILICVGIYLLIPNISGLIYRRYYINSSQYYYVDETFAMIYGVIREYAPAVIVSAALIFAGIKLLLGKSKNNKDSQDSQDNKNGGDSL